MRRRREWFHPMSEDFMALWRVPAGRIPAVAEAEERLEHLRRNGPSAHAFTFRESFPPPGTTANAPADVHDRWLCPS